MSFYNFVSKVAYNATKTVNGVVNTVKDSINKAANTVKTEAIDLVINGAKITEEQEQAKAEAKAKAEAEKAEKALEKAKLIGQDQLIKQAQELASRAVLEALSALSVPKSE